jgi:hypothetical protein
MAFLLPRKDSRQMFIDPGALRSTAETDFQLRVNTTSIRFAKY